jgi:hypothetical protein
MGGSASTVRDLAVRTPESREHSADMWRALAICLVVLGVGYNTDPPTLALMALAATQVGVVLALQPAANRWLRRTRPWTAVVASNAVILTVFLWQMTAAAIAAVVLFPTGVMGQPPVDSAAWLLWRVSWMVCCAVILAVAVSGPDYHGPTGLPWGAVVTYLSGTAVLRVARTQPVRSREPV